MNTLLYVYVGVDSEEIKKDFFFVLVLFWLKDKENDLDDIY